MNGTPFSAACSMVWIAGQVASLTAMLPGGDGGGEARRRPASPSVTALVCTSATQPAPISRSVAKPETGTPSSRNPRAPRRTSARAKAQGGERVVRRQRQLGAIRHQPGECRQVHHQPSAAASASALRPLAIVAARACQCVPPTRAKAWSASG